MGLGVDQNVLRRSVGHQGLQNEAVADVFCAGVQLTVGKGPGAALAELDVAGGVQLPRGPEAVHVRFPPLHRTAPLQQDGPQARPGQHQGGKQPSGSGTHYHRRDGRGGQGSGQQITRRPLHAGDLFMTALQNVGLVFHIGLHGVYHGHALPGVHAAAQHPQGEKVLFPDLQDAGRLGGQGAHVGPGRQLDVFHFQHGSLSFLRSRRYFTTDLETRK